MSEHKIVIRAENENGPEITGSKAAAILASGGYVHAMAKDADGHTLHGTVASAHSNRSFRTGRVEDPVSVNWSSPGGSAAFQARLHAQAVLALVKAIELGGTDWFSPDHIPGWVYTAAAAIGNTDAEVLAFDAARAYGSGQFTINDAWQWAVSRAKERIGGSA
jgi:hypothetical protein